MKRPHLLCAPGVLAVSLALLPGSLMAEPGDTAATGQRDPAGTTQESRQPHYQSAPNPDAVQSEAQTQNPAQSQAVTATDGGPQLVAADELVGRDVMTQEGERIGTLQFVSVSLDQGSVSHLIVDTAGSDFAPGSTTQGSQGDTGQTVTSPTPQSGTASDSAAPGATAGTGAGESGAPGATRQQQGDLLILPWSVARLDAAGQGIVVAATGRHILNAPRLAREELNQLTEPALASYVIDYWAPVSELAALEGQRQQPTGAQQQGMQQQDMQQQTGEQQSGQQQTPQQSSDPSGMEKNNQSQSSTSDSQDPYNWDATTAENGKAKTSSDSAGQSAMAETGSQQSATGERSPAQPAPSQQGPVTTEGGQVVLVGQEVVAAITPPLFQLSKQLRGAQVVDRNGNQIGEIRQIMIDASTGDAAFAVVEGTSPGRAPVPLQSLSWSAEGITMLTADISNLRSNPTLTEQPEQATREDLAQLYERFGANPYWQQGASSTMGEQQ